VVSGSDEGNIRIWKSRASEKLGVMSRKEKEAKDHRDKLVEKWKHVGEVKKIHRQRYLPKAIHNAQRLRRTMLEARRKRDENRRAHTRKDIAEKMRPKPARKVAVERVDA